MSISSFFVSQIDTSTMNDHPEKETDKAETPAVESSETYELNRPEPVEPLVIGVPAETFPDECRVALVPSTVFLLKKRGLTVLIEAGAGEAAGFPDEKYQKEGAEIVAERAEVFSKADVILQVRAAGCNKVAGQCDIEMYREGQTIIATCDPLSEPEILRDLAEKKISLLSLELLPRITRAQSMDVLSSMATVAGYKAVLMAASITPRMFPMMMTAAGTVKPAKVFIMGAGVAGLQAIATAKRLGAVVKAYDVRPVVKEQIESLGGKFVEVNLETEASESTGGYAKEQTPEFLKKQQEVMTAVVAESDVVITTAAIPGRKSPVLVTAEMVKGMQPGSVIVDLAAERGGNCELTKLNETIVEHGVTILGPGNLPATVPFHASEMFARNISTLLLLLIKEGKLVFDTEDEVIHDTLVTHEGQLVNARIREILKMEPLAEDPPEPFKKPKR